MQAAASRDPRQRCRSRRSCDLPHVPQRMRTIRSPKEGSCVRFERLVGVVSSRARGVRLWLAERRRCVCLLFIYGFVRLEGDAAVLAFVHAHQQQRTTTIHHTYIRTYVLHTHTYTHTHTHTHTHTYIGPVLAETGRACGGVCRVGGTVGRGAPHFRRPALFILCRSQTPPPQINHARREGG